MLGHDSAVHSPHGPTPSAYQQIELLSRPAVKEAFESFADHDHDQSQSNPTTTRRFKVTSSASPKHVAGRSATTANTLKAVLYPNEMQVDLSSSATTAGYLGVETGGKVGTTFGGRGLTDDTIGTSSRRALWQRAFRAWRRTRRRQRIPVFATDNLPAAAPAYQASTTFPYAQAPV